MDEVVDVLDLLHCVVKDKAGVGVDPGFNRLFELRYQGLRVDTQPANVHGLLHLGNLTFNGRQVGNLLVENLERGEAGDDALENLLAHPVEGVKLIVKLLVLVVGAGAHCVDFLGEILLQRRARIEELLERDFQFLFPEELLVIVLVNKVIGGFFDLVEPVCDLLLTQEKDELILDLDQVVSIICSVGGVRASVKTAWHLD